MDPASADWLALQNRLGDLALGSAPSGMRASAHLTQSRHLAFLPPDALDLDLDDPTQRDFGEYELIEKLGQGGMGVVYRARQKALDREVAVKLLAAGPWASRDFIERFQREAQSAARMQHPNIVSIFEVGAHDELNYFSMQLVRGESLAALMSRAGPQDPRRAASLLRTVAEAVDYAHRLGVLHLDLKPGNVLLDERGEPQVADFGLARRLDDTLAADSDEVSGTPSYMAPEQATLKSRKLTPATDVYGLGAILYELLTGRPPFLGASPQETLRRLTTEAPLSPRALRPGIPADLEAICLKCLEKEPPQRFGAARGLVSDLAAFLDGRPVGARPLHVAQRAARWARREPRVALAAGAFVLALVAGLVATAIQWRRADAHAVDARDNLWRARAATAQAALADGDGFRGLRPLVQNLAEMEDAGRLDDARVERQRIGTILANAPRLLDFIRLPQGEAVTSVAISPDARRFSAASQSGDGLRYIRQFDARDLSEDWAIRPNEFSSGPGTWWGPQHGAIQYTADSARIVVRADMDPVFARPPGGDSIALDAHDGHLLLPPAPGSDFADLVFSDDGSHALVRYRGGDPGRPPDAGRFFATDGWRALGPRIAHQGYAEWLPAPDGRWLLGAGSCCRLTLFEPASLTPRWHLDLPAGDPVRAWRFSRDGMQLALGTRGGSVHLVDVGSGRHAPLPSVPTAAVRWLEFSGDGRTLLTLGEDSELTAWDVATREPRMAPIRPSNGRAAWAARIAGESLFLSTGTQLHSWSLAPRAPFDNLVVPAAARVRNRRNIGDFAFDVLPGAGMLVVGGSDGSLGLWRLPPKVLLRDSAAPLPSATLHFDGGRIVAVDGRSVQVLDAISEAPLSPALLHPVPVQFAELAFDGRALVTVAGRTVRVLDPATGALRGPPVVLPGTPLRADIARASPVVALTTGEYTGDRFDERVHVIDLDGRGKREHSPSMAGPLMELRIDPLGRYAVGTRQTGSGDSATTSIVDLTGSVRQCTSIEGPDTDGGMNGDTAIADDGRTAWFTGGLPGRRARIMRWDIEDCRILMSIVVPTIGTFPTLVASGDGLLAHRLVDDALVHFDSQGERREAPGLSINGSMAAIAVSRDEHRAAVATRNAVLIVDLARGERLSALLAAPIAGNDAIMQLAFAPDSTHLLARTIKGRWLRWSLPVATQDAATLASLASLLDPDGSGTALDAAGVDGLRHLLRTSLPATPQAAPAQPRPAIELAAAADDTTDPRFVPLDLAAAINVPLNGAWPTSRLLSGDMVTLAPGMQRLNGIDWRIEGGVQLSLGSGVAADVQPVQRASAPVPVPAVLAERVHALVSTAIAIGPDAAPHRMAAVVLVGADGRETALSIFTRRHVAPHFELELAEPSARIGWLTPWVASIRQGWGELGGWSTQSHVFAASLDVPPYTGPVIGVRLEIGESPDDAPLFHAVTLETTQPPVAGESERAQ
jgi:WD40 repeat protein